MQIKAAGYAVLGMMVVAWFSRMREFRADAGGARAEPLRQSDAAFNGLGEVPRSGSNSSGSFGNTSMS